MAKTAAVEAIARAEGAGFDVGEDLSLTSRQEFAEAEFDAKLAEAQRLAAEIRTTAASLAQADAGVAAAVTAAVATFAAVSFPETPAASEPPRDPSVQPVNNEIPKDEPQPADEGEPKPESDVGQPEAETPKTWRDLLVPDEASDAPDEAAEEADGADPDQPEDLDEALTTVAGAPVVPPSSVLDRFKDQMKGAGKDEAKGDTAAPSTEFPLAAPIVAAGPSVVDDQAARVDAAHRAVAAAEADLNAAAGQTYTQGPGGGAGRDVTDRMAQALFDARRDLTEQTRILEDLSQARTGLGGQPVGIPDLPPNADVQALPPAPSAFAEGSRALSEGSFGIIPDVAHDIEVFTNWGEHSGADRAGAVLDAAGLLPVPGVKPFTEAMAQGLDALSIAGRHVDDIPSGAQRSVDGPDGHQSVDVPGAQHAGDDPDYLAQLGVEDPATLLEASESVGGHLIERHVAQSPADLAARLEARPGLQTVSSFASIDEAASVVGEALQKNRAAVDSWLADGMLDTLILETSFKGGSVLSRGAEVVPATEARLVLMNNGAGGWYVLTGYPLP